MNAAPRDAAARYVRRRRQVSTLMAICALTVLLGLIVADRMAVFSSAAITEDGELLVCARRTLLAPDPAFVIFRRAQGAWTEAARLRGRPVATLKRGAGLAVLHERACSTYDADLRRVAFGRLPAEPPEAALHDALALPDRVLLLGRTRGGLVTGRLADDGPQLDGAPLPATLERVVAPRLGRLDGAPVAVWAERGDDGTTTLRLATIDLAARTMTVRASARTPGRVLDLCLLGDNGALELYSAGRLDGRSRIEWRTVGAAGFGPPGPVTFPRPLMHGSVLALTGRRAGALRRLTLCRIGSVEQIEARDPSGDWSAPQHLAGPGQAGRLAVVVCFALLIVSAFAVVACGLAMARERPPAALLEPEFRTTSAQPPAPFPLRGAAYVLDSVLLFPLIAVALERLLGADPAALTELVASRPLAVHLTAMAIQIPYFMACELAFGGSVGKWLFGIEVTTIAGEPPGPAAVLWRGATRIVDSALFVGLLPIGLTPLGQRFGDVWGDTLVSMQPLPDEEEDEEIDVD